VVEFQVWVVAAGKEAFRLVCEIRQNVILIIMYLVCFAEVEVAAVVEDAAAVVVVVEDAAVVVVDDDDSRVKSQGVVSGECWHTV
jgi:hypothetical protein